MQVATIYVEGVKILIKRSRDLVVLVLFWLGSADVIALTGFVSTNASAFHWSVSDQR